MTTKDSVPGAIYTKALRLDVTKGAGGAWEAILSDGSLDRHGDVVEPSAWPPLPASVPLLHQHKHEAPVGKVTRLRVEGGRLLGRIEMAPEGTSTAADEAARLVAAGIVNSVSVGFIVKKAEPIATGRRFLDVELIEISVVAVGANRNARVLPGTTPEKAAEMAKRLRIADAKIKAARARGRLAR
jgi:HK97 family phage prohead protease